MDNPEQMQAMHSYTMNNSRRLSAIIVMGLLTAVVAVAALSARVDAAHAEERLLPGKELRQLFPGQFRARVRGYDVRFVALADGRLKGFYGALTDEGRWSLRGNRLCIMLKDWLDGKTTCSAVRRARGPWYMARGIRFRRM